MPGQQGVLQLGKHRVVIPDDVGEQRVANPDTGYRVAAKFGRNRDRLPPASSQLTDSRRQGGGQHHGEHHSQRVLTGIWSDLTFGHGVSTS